jgi:membrane-associated phospholipid phosphatase
MRNLSVNGTDRITILYNVIVVGFTLIFQNRIVGYGWHLALNLSIVLVILLAGMRRGSRWNTPATGTREVPPVASGPSVLGVLHLWYPLILYGGLYYQTGLINTVVVPGFVDSFFFNLDVRIFGEFPGFILSRMPGSVFFDEFFHFFYFSYYLIIPLTGVLLYRKDTGLFKRFMFQLSSLFYVCYVIYIFLPVEGPIPLRNEYYLQHGLFGSIMDYIWAKGENPGAGFPSSHVAVAFLVAWWGGTYFPRLRIIYWLIFLFLSIATVYCMFHYAVDVIGGLVLGVLAVLLFAWVDRNSAKDFVGLQRDAVKNESSRENPSRP